MGGKRIYIPQSTLILSVPANTVLAAGMSSGEKRPLEVDESSKTPWNSGKPRWSMIWPLNTLLRSLSTDRRVMSFTFESTIQNTLSLRAETMLRLVMMAAGVPLLVCCTKMVDAPQFWLAGSRISMSERRYRPLPAMRVPVNPVICRELQPGLCVRESRLTQTNRPTEHIR
jgi:hypothetical protein